MLDTGIPQVCLFSGNVGRFFRVCFLFIIFICKR